MIYVFKSIVKSNQKLALVLHSDDEITSVIFCDTRLTATLRTDELLGGFSVGMRVVHKPKNKKASFGCGIVIGVEIIINYQIVLVEFDNGDIRKIPSCFLSYTDNIELLFCNPMVQPYQAEKFRLKLLAYALEFCQNNSGIFSKLEIDPLPHQVNLVHRIISSGNLNWLIADDVGLGKTVELGMLVSSLKSSNRARRVLIITPSGLTRQWKEELYEKFGFDFRVYNRDFFIKNSREWKFYDHVIGSIDILKRTEHLTAILEADDWDLIVFDEAHKLGKDKSSYTGNYLLAEGLRNKTENFIFMSATPHQGKSEKFNNLLKLLRPEVLGDPSLVKDMVIRNNKSEVRDINGELIFKGKKTIPRKVALGNKSDFSELDRALQDYFERIKSSSKSSSKLVVNIYRKLAASSIEAIKQALIKRRDRIKRESVSEFLIKKIDEDFDERYWGEFEELLGDNAENFFAEELQYIDSLIIKLEALKNKDIKGDEFLELVKEITNAGEKVLIFTEYRTTQQYLQGLLNKKGLSVALINGGMTEEEKHAAIHDFNNDVRFLICTEAGGEGLNLHKKCHKMINYDLPWNPMRLAQRVGRLYRYGQKFVVEVYNIYSPDTLDARIVEVIYQKIDSIIEDLSSVGGGFDSNLADDIFGQVVEDFDFEGFFSRIEEGESNQSIIDEINNIKITEQSRNDFYKKRNQLFEYTNSYNPAYEDSQLKIGNHHLKSFIIGMAKIMGIIVENVNDESFILIDKINNQKVIFGFDRERIAGDVIFPDLQNPMVEKMIANAKSFDFDGYMANVVGDSDFSLISAIIRWNDEYGRLVRQEFAIIKIDEKNNAQLNSEAISKWLLNEQQDAFCTLDCQSSIKKWRIANSSINQRMTQLNGLYPDAPRWIAGGVVFQKANKEYL